MDLNKCKILDYLQFVQHQFLVHFLVTTLFYYYFVITIKSSWIIFFAHVVLFFLFFLFPNLDLEVSMPLFFFWFKKPYKLWLFSCS
jgi:hypothetical protein